jgi:hypothetical protein
MYFDVLEANSKFMGNITISKNGVLMYSKTMGCLDVENKIRADENSKHKIGSRVYFRLKKILPK